MHDGRFGQLDHDVLARQLVRPELAFDVLHAAVVDQVARREIQGHLAGEAFAPEPSAGLHRHREHGPGEGVDQLARLDQRHEFARGEEAALGVTPAHERLHAEDPAGAQLLLGLEVQHQLAFVERLGEFGEQQQLVGRVGVGAPVVEAHAQAVVLGPVHRHVGGAQQLVAVGAVLGVQGQPEARADLQAHAADVEGALERVADPMGALQRRIGGFRVAQQDRELVAAQPAGQRVLVPRHALEPLRDRAQEIVADLVPQRVVDLLEPVEVEQHDRRPGAGAQPVGETFEGLVQDDPVGQAGQRVVARPIEQVLQVARARDRHRQRAGHRLEARGAARAEALDHAGAIEERDAAQRRALFGERQQGGAAEAARGERLADRRRVQVLGGQVGSDQRSSFPEGSLAPAALQRESGRGAFELGIEAVARHQFHVAAVRGHQVGGHLLGAGDLDDRLDRHPHDRLHVANALDPRREPVDQLQFAVARLQVALDPVAGVELLANPPRVLARHPQLPQEASVRVQADEGRDGQHHREREQVVGGPGRVGGDSLRVLEPGHDAGADAGREGDEHPGAPADEPACDRGQRRKRQHGRRADAAEQQGVGQDQRQAAVEEDADRQRGAAQAQRDQPGRGHAREHQADREPGRRRVAGQVAEERRGEHQRRDEREQDPHDARVVIPGPISRRGGAGGWRVPGRWQLPSPLCWVRGRPNGAAGFHRKSVPGRAGGILASGRRMRRTVRRTAADRAADRIAPWARRRRGAAAVARRSRRQGS